MMKNWEVVVQFKVHGMGTTLFGDGLVIWYTKERMTEGPVFGSMNNFHGLAIFLDTYSNHNGPHNVSWSINGAKKKNWKCCILKYVARASVHFGHGEQWLFGVRSWSRRYTYSACGLWSEISSTWPWYVYFDQIWEKCLNCVHRYRKSIELEVMFVGGRSSFTNQLLFWIFS